MFSLLSCTVIGLSLAASANAQSTIALAVAAKALDAPKISQIIAPSFAGMGIEPTNLYAFTGGPHHNRLTPQLLQNLGDYSGVPPQLRIGGNSQDNMLWDSSADEYYLVQNTHPTASGNTPSDLWTFGPTYFECINRLPLGTPIAFGLNLAYNGDDYISRIVAEARAALENIKRPTVISFEIGNEPDLYNGNGFRNVSYGGVAFVQDWLSRAQAVWSQVLKPLNYSSNFFEPATTASTIGKPTFEIASLVQEGINITANGSSKSYIAGWNQHDYFYFVNVTMFPLTLEYLMTLENTELQFAYWAKQIGIALGTGLPYNLREMASAGPTGLQGISDTFGAALWTLNFFLYAQTLNIDSVGIHMTENSWAAPWQPNTVNGRNAYIRPSYYAFAAMAQLIGNCNGTARVSNITAGSDSSIRAYAMYADDDLRSIVLINANLANATTSNKNNVTFEVTIPSLKNEILYLSELTADGADSTDGTSWNGLTYSNDDGTSSGDSRITAGSARFDSNGVARIQVRDSQAIIANVGWVLGTNEVLTPNSTDPRVHNSKSDAAKASASTAAAVGTATSLIAGATSLSSNPDPGSGQKKGDAHSTSTRDTFILAMVAGAAGLGAVNLLWRGSW